MYRIIKNPVTIPKGVTVKLDSREISFKGPKGETALTIPGFVIVEIQNDTVTVTTQKKESRDEIKVGGTIRQLISNNVNGVATGFKKTLIFEGIGYKASVQNKTLLLNMGHSHPINYTLPTKVSATVEGNKINLESCEKELLGQTAAEIKKYKLPEPYKGKGIRYSDETIKRKAGKTSKK